MCICEQCVKHGTCVKPSVSYAKFFNIININLLMGRGARNVPQTDVHKENGVLKFTRNSLRIWFEIMYKISWITHTYSNHKNENDRFQSPLCVMKLLVNLFYVNSMRTCIIHLNITSHNFLLNWNPSYKFGFNVL